MRNIYSIFTFILLLVSISACSSEMVNPTTTPNTVSDAGSLAIVQKYIADNKLLLNPDANNNAYYYGISKSNPTGKMPVKNDLVGVLFKYYRLNNGSPILIDTTRNAQRLPYSFVYNAYSSLLNTPASLMKVGEKATFIFYASAWVTEPTMLEIEILSSKSELEQISSYMTQNYAGSKFDSTSTGLRFFKTKVNTSGDALTTGKTVTVNYVGKLLFDSRKTSNGSSSYSSQFDAGGFSFTLGAGGIIAGFDEGISKMRVGEKAVIILPSKLAYGTNGSLDSQGAYVIPPSSPILFEVEVTGVK